MLLYHLFWYLLQGKQPASRPVNRLEHIPELAFPQALPHHKVLHTQTPALSSPLLLGLFEYCGSARGTNQLPCAATVGYFPLALVSNTNSSGRYLRSLGHC